MRHLEIKVECVRTTIEHLGLKSWQVPKDQHNCSEEAEALERRLAAALAAVEGVRTERLGLLRRFIEASRAKWALVGNATEEANSQWNALDDELRELERRLFAKESP